MAEALPLLLVVAAAALFSVWWKRRDGRIRDVEDRFTAEEVAAVGAPAGTAVLLEFTAPNCAPCRATKQVLEDVSALWPEVALVTIDVADALSVVKAHHVLRAPTTFVLAPDGAVRGRISGVPDPGELADLLDGDGGPRPPRGRKLSADLHVETPSRARPRWARRSRAA
ncbi:MAG TPA: thioredoxin family protein [Egibacteraceae bacterium]|nr:thioredoxin family protein [Egibacteraceae bacterium]